jgi:hypothetical protein
MDERGAFRQEIEGQKGIRVLRFEGGKVSGSWLTAEDTYAFDEFW